MTSGILRCLLSTAAIGLLALGPTSTADAGPQPFPSRQDVSGQAAPSIYSVTDNQASYPGGIPVRSKLEITFQASTVAVNPQWPYDAATPPGLVSGQGISIDALFTPDNWQTVYTQPAFYYQHYDDNGGQLKSGAEWFYPTGQYSWVVRFSPPFAGSWQYRLTAVDAGGQSQTGVYSFNAVQSDSKGFVRISSTDSRYFEFEDGSYFPALGYNMNWDHVRWVNPVRDNTNNFRIMGENGIQLVRMWLSEWGIFTSAWNPWKAIQMTGYIPPPALSVLESYADREVSMKVQADWNRCMFIGSWMSAPPAVKRNTTYRISIRYKTKDINPASLIVSGQPYGLVAKVGGWLWDSNESARCYHPSAGTAVTPHVSTNTGDWQFLEGQMNIGATDFLPNFYLVMDNLTQGQAFIDEVQIREDMGGGQFGSNIISKPTWNQHAYFDQRNSYAFDKALNIAEQNGVYLRPVLMEKNEWYMNHVDYDGVEFPDDSRCSDSDPNNNPSRCPSNNWFYGNWRTMTKTRWLQQSWWRYVQARWGYSTAIHSWELLNEGDPFNGLHWALADEFGEYMRQFGPNRHPVSTSFWQSFPLNGFWDNADYPNIDFADVHQYLDPADTNLRLDVNSVLVTSAAEYYDSALVTQKLSMLIGAKQQYGPRKPVIRGETGYHDEITADTQGVWLHNYVWAGINPGGLIEQYWYENTHIYQENGPGTYAFDHRGEFGNFYRFIKDVSLSNGYYVDAIATTSDPDLRAWGQKERGGGRAHLWIANAKHTWKAVVDGTTAPALSGAVTVPGLRVDTAYRVEWWNTYTGAPTRVDTISSDAGGNLQLPISNLATDTAVKITAPPGAYKVFTPSIGVGFSDLP